MHTWYLQKVRSCDKLMYLLNILLSNFKVLTSLKYNREIFILSYHSSCFIISISVVNLFLSQQKVV